MKLALSPRQKALWREISVPFDFDAEYEDDTLVALEEYLSDYMLYHETINDELTPRGDEIHALLSYITTEYRCLIPLWRRFNPRTRARGRQITW